MADDDQDRDAGESTDLTALAEFVERMIAVANTAGLASISIKTDALKLRLQSGTAVPTSATANANPAPVADDVPSAAQPLAAPGYVITAPMVGTFYHSTSPSDPPLIQVGDRIEAGQLVGIIEAMKIMNEITSDRGGTVTEIIVPNAVAVEYGSPLIRLGP